MTGFITVELGRISEDNSLQMRASTSQATIEEYRRLLDDAMESKDPKYPEPVWPFAEPVRLFNVRAADGLYLVADGFHRVQAAREAGWEWVQATVVDGTVEDATLAAIKSNIGHGLARTTADKRRAVLAALRHPSLAGQSDREIARICGVSPPTIKTVRSDLLAEMECKNFTPADPVTARWSSLPDDVIHKHAQEDPDFRWSVIWHLHAYGISERAIARRAGLSLEHVRRLLHPLEHDIQVPSCIHTDDHELWQAVFRGFFARFYRLKIELMMSLPGIPQERLREALEVYSDAAADRPSVADFPTEAAVAFYSAAESAAINWQDTGMIDSESVRLEMESMLTYLNSEEHQLWVENRQQEVAIG